MDGRLDGFGPRSGGTTWTWEGSKKNSVWFVSELAPAWYRLAQRFRGYSTQGMGRQRSKVTVVQQRTAALSEGEVQFGAGPDKAEST